MTLFDRIKRFLSGLLKAPEMSPRQQAEALIKKQKLSQKRLQESVTELIFQRKKFESLQKKLASRKFGLSQDLEMAVRQDRDEISIKLMEEMDALEIEIAENSKNLQLICDEIKTAKKVEVDLSHQLERSRSQFAILVSRSQSVKMRESMQTQFSKLHEELSHVQPGLSEIEENILHLEARLENAHGSQEQWKDEVLEMRRNREDHVRKARLAKLKQNYKSKSLPGRVLEPEIIFNSH